MAVDPCARQVIDEQPSPPLGPFLEPISERTRQSHHPRKM